MGRPKKNPRYRIDPDTGCWVWLLATSTTGYGQTWDGVKVRQAYVVEYERKYGPVPDGLELDHLCRNRLCVNPDHMEPVYAAVNVRRGRLAKLTQAQVASIRVKYNTGTISQKSLASEFGVSESCIAYVVAGKSWSEPGQCRKRKRFFPNRLGSGNRRLTINDVEEIRALRKAGRNLEEIGAKFSVSSAHVSNIIRGKRRATPLVTKEPDNGNGSNQPAGNGLASNNADRQAASYAF